MNSRDRIQFLENDSSILKMIASLYSRDSKEYAALERAAFALWYVVTQDFNKFFAFVQDCKADLTPAQKTHLQAMGIQVD